MITSGMGQLSILQAIFGDGVRGGPRPYTWRNPYSSSATARLNAGIPTGFDAR